MPKLVRITTKPIALKVLLRGQMRFMKDNGFDVTMISDKGTEVESLIVQEDCPHIAVKLTRKITPLSDLISLIRLTRILKKIKPDIVHTHTPKAGLIGLWAAKFAGVSIRLHTIAGLPWMEYKGLSRMILKFVEKLTSIAAHQIYPNSFVQKDFLHQNKIARKKMKVLGNGSSNGIDTVFFSVAPELELKAIEIKKNNRVPDDGHIWIFAGRVVKDKGVMEMLDAFCQLHHIYPEDQLWIIGNEEPDLDPLPDQYRNLLTKHNRIKSMGFQEDVRPFLTAADTLLFPSYREGFPNVPLQAACLNCTLLLSDINGCNEIVKNGEHGILFPAKNTTALYEAMKVIRSNPETAEKFKTSAKEKVIKFYDRKFIWNLLLDEYKKWIAINH
ncbi:MAG: glycosyltransferase family 4 protein [Ferruginibacter sp.]|nr:glycosyltransferase family 4 protein [Ferruginibacter sp.]